MTKSSWQRRQLLHAEHAVMAWNANIIRSLRKLLCYFRTALLSPRLSPKWCRVTSQVTYVTIVPWEWERDTASSFEGRFGNASSVTGYLKHVYKHPMHLTLAGGLLWRKLMSVCKHKRAPVEHIILFFPRGTDRNARSMAKRRSVSFPFSGNYGYIRNLRRSLPKGTLHCVLFRGSLWERYANTAMLREKCPKAGFLSHRLEEHHPCSAGQLKARHHRLAHESMALGVEVSESDSLNWEETSTLDTMNS